MKIILTTLAIVSLAAAAGATVFSTNTADKDAFVRALAPTNNYGGGGALSVSGTNATVNNPTNGAFDSFISFSTAAMVASFNAAFGTNQWVITSATLNLTENPAPGNPVFNYGTGLFQVRWIANDTWPEGSGTPSSLSTNGGITYSQEPVYLNSNLDMNLGAFDFPGTNVNVSCPLALATSFVTDMQAGGEVGLFLTAIDPSIGFVFYSRQFGGLPSTHPALVVSASAVPPVIAAASVAGMNLVLAVTNGLAGGTYYVLTSTNLATPPGQWTSVLTNVAGSASFLMTVTNAANPTAPSPQFFILQTY